MTHETRVHQCHSPSAPSTKYSHTAKCSATGESAATVSAGSKARRIFCPPAPGAAGQGSAAHAAGKSAHGARWENISLGRFGERPPPGRSAGSARQERREARYQRRRAKRQKKREERCAALGPIDKIFSYRKMFRYGRKCCNSRHARSVRVKASEGSFRDSHPGKYFSFCFGRLSLSLLHVT